MAWNSSAPSSKCVPSLDPLSSSRSLSRLPLSAYTTFRLSRLIMTPLPSRNVLGGPLKPCSSSPLTGFYRNGRCDTCAEDAGCHTVCVEVSESFLTYSRQTGNDLSTPRPEYRFPGLKPGDRWCVCAGRWLEAFEAGFPSPVILAATHERTLEIVSLDLLRQHAAG